MPERGPAYEKEDKEKPKQTVKRRRASGSTWAKVSCNCVLSAEGEVMEEGSFRNAESSLAKQLGKMPLTRIALETGTQSGWISRQLKSCGHEVIVAHARDLQRISRSDRKNDRNDAEKLASYARLDSALSNPIQHRTAQQQTDLCAIRARGALVRARALLVNTARGLANTEGLRLPPSITPTWGSTVAQRITAAVPNDAAAVAG